MLLRSVWLNVAPANATTQDFYYLPQQVFYPVGMGGPLKKATQAGDREGALIQWDFWKESGANETIIDMHSDILLLPTITFIRIEYILSALIREESLCYNSELTSLYTVHLSVRHCVPYCAGVFINHYWSKVRDGAFFISPSSFWGLMMGERCPAVFKAAM